MAGGGTVRSTAGGPGAVNCDNTIAGYSGACNQAFAAGSSVTLTATPSAGYSFAGWFSPDTALLPNSSTGCSGMASSCTFAKASSTQYLTAVFVPSDSDLVTQVYSDITSGPTTGGEANKGIYLSVFGTGFGSTGAGTTAKMYLNNIEVANYKYLGASRGRTNIQQLSVQLGSLGGVANGKALPVKVVINGRVANDPNHLTFMTNPGKIYFASLSGNDTTGTVDDITKPFRTVQKSTVNNNGSAGCPVAPSIQTVATAGVWGLVRPGDFLVMRAGNWTDVSKDNFFLRTQNKSGNAPTGNNDTGPITIMGYPGEYVMIDRTNTVNRASGGGISSADSARQELGCGAWITLANLRVESGFNDGPITTQAGATNPNGSHWRVVNNEMTAISCQNNDNCKGAGVSGSGVGGYWAGNYVHDIYDKPGNGTDLENHGFYMDGVGSYEVAYNRIENIYGGNGVQTYSTTTSTTTNAHIHHNIIKVTGKHGINLSDGTATGIVIHDNVVYDTARASLRFNTVNLSGAKVYNNTFYKARLGGALMNDWNLPTGAIDFRNNIVVPLGTAYLSEGASGLTNGSSMVASNNLWYSGTGSVIGGSNVTNDPRFVSATDLRLLSTSPAIDTGTAAVSSVVADDNDSLSRPSGGSYDIGAYEAQH